MWAVALDFGIGAILAHLIVRIPFLTFLGLGHGMNNSLLIPRQ